MKRDGSAHFTKADGKKLEIKLAKDLTEELTKKLTIVIDTKLDEKLNGIRDEMKQWHSDIFDIVDGLASEVKDNREFREITTNQIVEDRERIGKLEKKVFGVV